MSIENSNTEYYWDSGVSFKLYELSIVIDFDMVLMGKGFPRPDDW